MNYYKSSKKSYETDEEIKELALNYLDKYQPSKKDLRLYLFRKVLSDDQGSANKSIILEQIDKVINNLEHLGLINDDLYSEMKSKNFLKRGYSLNKIKMTLSQKGIDSELLKRTIENIKNDNEDPDFYSARIRGALRWVHSVGMPWRRYFLTKLTKYWRPLHGHEAYVFGSSGYTNIFVTHRACLRAF